MTYNIAILIKQHVITLYFIFMPIVLILLQIVLTVFCVMLWNSLKWF